MFLNPVLMRPKVDPWRPYTPHSTYGGAVERDDTLLRPFKIIPGALFFLSVGIQC